MTDRLPCLDARGSEGWTCIEFDGTGLWCDNCLRTAAVPAKCGHVPPESPDPPPGPAAVPKIPCVLPEGHVGRHNHWPFWA